jgi:rhodanese-related sulfurtransferase/glutaredoxin
MSIFTRLNNTMKTVLFLLLSAIAISFRANGQAVQQLAPGEFENEITKGGIQLLDVRTSGEYRDGHLKNALQADWTNEQQFKDRVQYLDKSKPVYVYCLSGGRSSNAAAWLQQHGYTGVYSLKGGINAWKLARKPVEGMAKTRQMSLQAYQDLIKGKGTYLVDFGAGWCPPCKKMEPVLESLKREAGPGFTLVKIDAGLHTSLLKEMGVEALPVFIVYRNGKEAWRKQGVTSLEELKAHLQD